MNTGQRFSSTWARLTQGPYIDWLSHFPNAAKDQYVEASPSTAAAAACSLSIAAVAVAVASPATSAFNVGKSPDKVKQYLAISFAGKVPAFWAFPKDVKACKKQSSDDTSRSSGPATPCHADLRGSRHRPFASLLIHASQPYTSPSFQR